MKIDRRTFLSSVGALVIGGAAGSALSPLPYKLTDDLSIWTQMWPWTPVPQDGEANYVNSVCTLCPGGCGISVRKIDDRAVKIEGMKGHPVNDGGICMLGISALQLLYGTSRVKAPMKQTGKRGEDNWKEISWDEAISEVAKKLKEIREKGESHTVACITGSKYGTVPQLFSRFMAAYGSPNFMTVPSVQDSYEIALKLMHGVDAIPGFDVENANFVLSFGTGMIEGWGSPVRMFKANSKLRENKAKIVQIEARLSNTAAKADKWIPIKPGTEAALALGLASVIIKESLYNKAFVDSSTNGFEAFKSLVLNNYAPESVAKIVGIEDPNVIIALAKEFAGSSNPLALCGKGQGNTPGSMYEVMAVHALNALVGNINKKGGVWTLPAPNYIQWAEPELDETAKKGIQQVRIDGAGGEKYPCAKSLLNRFPACVCEGKDYPVQALLVSGANPCYTMSDPGSVKKAFEKIPFVVSFSSYMDETSKQADIILPNHTFLESYQDVPAPVGLQKPIIGISRPVVKPQLNTRHVGDSLIQIAKAMGGNIEAAFAWESYEACLEQTMGDNWKTLNKEGFLAKADFTPPAIEGSFATPSGKFEFFTKDVKTAEEKEDTAYPLVLMPYDSMRLANGAVGNTPFLTKTVDDTVLKGKDILVEVNPGTAAKYSLKEGKYAILKTAKGEAKVKVHLFEGIMPDVIAMPRGLGHTAYDKYIAGKGINVNDLIIPSEDPISGLDAASVIRAKLTIA